MRSRRRVIVTAIAAVLSLYAWARAVPGIIHQGHPIWWAALLLIYPVGCTFAVYGSATLTEGLRERKNRRL